MTYNYTNTKCFKPSQTVHIWLTAKHNNEGSRCELFLTATSRCHASLKLKENTFTEREEWCQSHTNHWLNYTENTYASQHKFLSFMGDYNRNFCTFTIPHMSIACSTVCETIWDYDMVNTCWCCFKIWCRDIHTTPFWTSTDVQIQRTTKGILNTKM